MLTAPLGNKKLPYFGSVLGCNLIGSVCYNLVLAIILQNMLDAVAYQDSRYFQRGLWIAVISLLVALIVEPVLAQIQIYCIRSMMARIRTELSEKVTYETCMAYEQLGRGDVLTRLTKDLTQMEQIYIRQIPTLGFTCVHGGVSMALLFYYDARLAVLALLLGFIQLFVNRKMTGRIEELAKARQISSTTVIQQVVDLLDGWTDIVIAHSERHFLEKFGVSTGELSKKEQRAERSMRNATSVDGSLSQLNRVILMAVGMVFVLRGQLSVGAIAAILSLQGNAMYFFQNIASFGNQLTNAMPSMKRIWEIREVELEPRDEATSGEETVSDSAISLQDVSFSFGEKKILDHACLEIPKGAFVLFMGASGAGKSTLGKILLRFYEESSGKCQVMGVSSQGSGIAKVREQIAYMDQYHKIFSMSVIDNLRLVQKVKDDEEIYRVCKLTGVDEFVKKWKEGYEYVIDDDFSNLSGGQKQRLALARMLLCDRPVLLIDEGTANLDEETEQVILQSILQYRGKKTILMITHKPALAQWADLVYELKDRKIVRVQGA